MTGGLYQGRRNPLDSHDPTAPPAEELRYGGGHYLDLRLVGFFIFAKRCRNALRGQEDPTFRYLYVGVSLYKINLDLNLDI